MTFYGLGNRCARSSECNETRHEKILNKTGMHLKSQTFPEAEGNHGREENEWRILSGAVEQITFGMPSSGIRLGRGT